MTLAFRIVLAWCCVSFTACLVWVAVVEFAAWRTDLRDPRRNSAVIEAERIIAVAASRAAHPSNRENKGTS